MLADHPVGGHADNKFRKLESRVSDTSWTVGLLCTAIAVCLLLQLHLVFVQPINWDEFRFLADIHSYQRGELSSVMLTFQVHLFGWLAGTGNEIDQIRVARLVMLALEFGTIAFIWKVSGRFFDETAALFAAIGYISFSFVLQHGASFRFDPIVTFLVMASVTLLLRERLGWIAMAVVGLALALATMVSVKTVLALPLIVAVGVYRLVQNELRRETFLRLLFGAAAALLFLAILYAWHVSSLSGASSEVSQEHLASSYSKTVGSSSLLPGYFWLRRALLENPLHWIVMIFGIWVAAARFRTSRSRALILLAFLLPLLTISFYRNAFPYFYSFIMAPASILFAVALERPEMRKYVLLVVLVWAGGTVAHYKRALSVDAESQRQTVELVHSLFPQPVPYIDRSSMIGTFPQSGVFLSSWWLENYRDAGRPIMRDLLRQTQPVFVIANSPQLKVALEGNAPAQMRLRFSEEDGDTLSSNFIHYSGPMWIAGKRFPVSKVGTETEFLIGGEYVLEGSGPVIFDGRAFAPGDKLSVTPGVHKVGAPATSQQVTFRWAAVPAMQNPAAPTELTFGRF